VHGDTGLATAQRATEIFFGAEVSQLSDTELAQIFADVPSKQLPRATLDAGLPILDALCEAGLTASKGESRRTVSQGGAYINNRRVDDIDRKLTADDLASETVVVLRAGKKKYALLRFA
jgi:tyrosyl-tRNA synthetase